MVSAAPTSTTNITGFFSKVTGFSFAKDAAVARLTISGSNSGRDRTSFLGRSDVGSSGGICGVTFGFGGHSGHGFNLLKRQQDHGKELAAVHQVMFDDRPQRKRREEGQRADNDHGADQQSDKQRTVGREGSAVDGTFFLAARLPAAASRGIRNRNRPISMASPIVRLYQGVLALMPAKALPLLPVPLDIGVQNLAEAMRTAVVQVRGRGAWRIPVAVGRESDHRAERAEDQNAEGGGDHRQHRHLDFLLFDLLAEVLRRPAHHQAGDEHREDAVQQDAVEAGAHAAEDDFAGHHVEQRHQAADAA